MGSKRGVHCNVVEIRESRREIRHDARVELGEWTRVVSKDSTAEYAFNSNSLIILDVEYRTWIETF